MRLRLGRVTIALAVLPATVAAALAAVIALDSPAPIPRLLAGDSLPGYSGWNVAEIPEVRQVTARDGAPLTYRLYPARPDRAVVLVHGSSGTSFSMHKVAQALQAAGATVYAIDLRGHGGSGTANGDSSYRGQLDDDLADFVKATGMSDAKIHRTLVGFSSGGGFVLREANGPNRVLFDAYIAVSPFIAHDSPTERPATGGWTSVAVPRLVALSLLDAAGLPWFQGLPVVRFATDAKPSESRTPLYSFRLLTGMQLGRQWRAAIAGIDRPAIVIVGAKDELFFADQFQPLFGELNPRIAVIVQPGDGHLDMITDPKACAAISSEWKRLSDGDQHAGRFDFKVREDFFAGMDGDRDAMERAMKIISDALAADPDNAQALVWRGDGRLYQAGQAFRRGAIAEGQNLSQQGIADMEKAVSLDPGNPAVRIPRATGLMPYALGLRRFDRDAADRLTQTAISDFEYIVAQARPTWSTMAEHDRGELLGALATGWLQLGSREKAEAYLDRMIAELPGTPYAANASLRRTDPSANKPLTCLGCH